jgi:hypothetical protein
LIGVAKVLHEHLHLIGLGEGIDYEETAVGMLLLYDYIIPTY